LAVVNVKGQDLKTRPNAAGRDAWSDAAGEATAQRQNRDMAGVHSRSVELPPRAAVDRSTPQTRAERLFRELDGCEIHIGTSRHLAYVPGIHVAAALRVWLMTPPSDRPHVVDVQ
jgi:hypothetical protein